MAILNDLAKALSSKTLPPKALEVGQELMMRLQSPVRVVILGLPKSGKSELFNMILGKEIIPSDARLPTLEVKKAESDRTIFTLADGSVQEFDGIALDQARALSPVFIELQGDKLPALEKISLMEVVAGISFDEQTRAIRWASRRADIMLWCSQEFSTVEQALWANVPDDLKDQSSMALTKADLLSSQGILTQRINELQDVVADNFNSFLPVATLQAIASKTSTGGGDEVFTSSGGKAVVLSILRQVQMARRTDMAQVERFLAQIAPPAAKPQAKVVDAPAEKPTSTAPKPTKATAKPAEQSKVETATENVTEPNAYIDLQSYVGTRMTELLAELPDFSTDDIIRNVIEHSMETIETLNDKLMGAVDDAPDLEKISEQVLDASDIMLLLQFEEEEATAMDAVTLLLQLHRDLSVGAAG